MTQKQKENFEIKTKNYQSIKKPERIHTQEEIVLRKLADSPNQWFFTWEMMGPTPWGFLSHSSHATLRKLEQEEKIVKDYIGRFVVYTHKWSIEQPRQEVLL